MAWWEKQKFLESGTATTLKLILVIRRFRFLSSGGGGGTYVDGGEDAITISDHVRFRAGLHPRNQDDGLAKVHVGHAHSHDDDDGDNRGAQP